MKVYVVTSEKDMFDDWEDSSGEKRIDAIFTDKTDAEIYCAIHHCDNIEEYETHKHQFKTEKKPKFCWCGYWNIKSDICAKVRFSQIKRTYTLDDVDEIKLGINYITVKITTDTTVSVDDGNKLVKEKFYKWFYENMKRGEINDN